MRRLGRIDCFKSLLSTENLSTNTFMKITKNILSHVFDKNPPQLALACNILQLSANCTCYGREEFSDQLQVNIQGYSIYPA